MVGRYAVLVPVRRLVGEDQAPGRHEHPTDALAEGDLHSRRLVGGFSADLPDGLLHGEHAVHPGVGVGQAAAVLIWYIPWFAPISQHLSTKNSLSVALITHYQIPSLSHSHFHQIMTILDIGSEIGNTSP